MQINVIKADTLKPHPKEDALGFGTIFTDHMFNMDFSREKGWHNPRIEPYGPISMDPSTMVLHYGQAIFEGLKAFRTDAGEIRLFRPRENFKRLNNSARAMCIPEFDEEFMLSAMKQLLNMEKAWVPSAPGTSLYIRPAIVAMDPFIGLRASNTYRFFIILSPVGAYYKEGFNPIKIRVSKDRVRAVRGGVGDSKTAGNYAASLYATEDANKLGYAQVLWLDGVELKYVEEVGAMNIFFVIDDEIVTPELNGSILPGITRASLIQLGKEWGLKVTERKLAIDEIMAAHKEGRLSEVFGSGTAAVVSPVGTVEYDGNVMEIGDGSVGPLANRFYKAITDIQSEKTPGPEGWIESI